MLRQALAGALAAVAIVALAAAPAPAAAPRFAVQEYSVTAGGSFSQDWSERSEQGPAGCKNWFRESGSETTDFSSRRPAKVIVLTGRGLPPWSFSGSVRMNASVIRLWNQAGGSALEPGCPNVCSGHRITRGPPARAADGGECFPAAPWRPRKADCGRRAYSRFVAFSIDLDFVDEDDLFPLDPTSTFRVGYPLPAGLIYKTCKLRGTGGPAALHVELTAANVRGVRRLRVGQSRRFTTTRVGIPCSRTPTRNETCSLDFRVRVRVERTR